jgi:hypothetical protein
MVGAWQALLRSIAMMDKRPQVGPQRGQTLLVSKPLSQEMLIGLKLDKAILLYFEIDP